MPQEDADPRPLEDTLFGTSAMLSGHLAKAVVCSTLALSGGLAVEVRVQLFLGCCVSLPPDHFHDVVLGQNMLWK